MWIAILCVAVIKRPGRILLGDLTAYDNIAISLRSDRISTKEERKRVESVMVELDILALKKQYPKTLSGGEKQRVSVARALVRNPDLILADEPTGALDQATGQQLMALFYRFHQNGHIIFMVTHDDMLADMCSKTLLLKDGKLSECKFARAPTL